MRRWLPNWSLKSRTLAELQAWIYSTSSNLDSDVNRHLKLSMPLNNPLVLPAQTCSPSEEKEPAFAQLLRLKTLAPSLMYLFGIPYPLYEQNSLTVPSDISRILLLITLSTAESVITYLIYLLASILADYSNKVARGIWIKWKYMYVSPLLTTL